MTKMTNRLLISICLIFMSLGISYSQSEEMNDSTSDEKMDTMIVEETPMNAEEQAEKVPQIKEETVEPSPSFHQILKTKFIEHARILLREIKK